MITNNLSNPRWLNNSRWLLLSTQVLVISAVSGHGIHLPHDHDHDHDDDHHHEHHHNTNSIASKLMQLVTSESYSLDYNVYISIFLVSLPSIQVFLGITSAFKFFNKNSSGASPNLQVPATILRGFLAMAIGSQLAGSVFEMMPTIFNPRDKTINYTFLQQYIDGYDKKTELLYTLMFGIFTMWFIQRQFTILNISSSCSHDHSDTKEINHKHENSEEDTKSSLGYLLGDFIHNFADGIALAATYKFSFSLGQVSTIAILLHEVPHELGDFAVQLRRNVSIGKILLSQIATAVSAFIGAYLVLNDVSLDNEVVISFVCGSFIYLALCDMMPDLMSDKKISWIDLVIEIASFGIGLYLV